MLQNLLYLQIYIYLLFCETLLFKLYKPIVLFVGQRQTAQTQIRRRNMRRLISVSSVCSQNVLLEFEKQWKNTQRPY